MSFYNEKLNATRWLTSLAVSVTLLSPIALNANGYKHNAAPAQDISKQHLPHVKDSSISSHSSMIPLSQMVKADSMEGKWSQTIVIDSDKPSSLIILSPDIEQWQVSVKSPTGKDWMNEADSAQSKIAPSTIYFGEQGFLGKKLDIPASSVGRWNISLTRKNAISKSHSIKSLAGKGVGKTQTRSKDNIGETNIERRNQNQAQDLLSSPKGFILVKGDTDYKLVSHLNTKYTTVDSDIVLTAYMIRAAKGKFVRHQLSKQSPQQGTLENVSVEVTLPDSSRITLDMNDNGLNGDNIAGDGQFSVRLPSHLKGVYSTHVFAKGTRSDGLVFTRTTSDIFPIEMKAFEFLKHSAKGSHLGNNVLSIAVPVKQLSSEYSNVFLAGEVWGTNLQGKLEAAAWVGGIVEPIKSENLTTLDIGLDARWLTQANLKGPFLLKNLRLQTVDSNTPIEKIDNLKLDLVLTDTLYTQRKLDVMGKLKMTNDMLSMQAPQQQKYNLNKASSQSPVTINGTGSKLVLVHGYCSSGSWNSSSFSNSVEFKDYKQNRSHDAFARKIRDFGAAYNSFGIVAHSQGGAAALHLYAKYTSGLDYATGGRRIQSVGTPYRGTALAGNLAALGQVFGIQCGKNTDLTYNGASNWLSTIPSWAKSNVHYFTTSFKDRWWAYDYCHLATDLFLDDPEDGTTEKWAGQLSGGNNRGHKTGWCHTSGMRDPKQTSDSSRNSSMSSNASR